MALNTVPRIQGFAALFVAGALGRLRGDREARDEEDARYPLMHADLEENM